MEKIDQLWLERRGEFWQIAARYLKLLGNSGFMFSLYVLILIGGVYYQRWISGLSDSFPTEWILMIVFSALVFHTPVRTFIKHADLVFLLPLEKRLSSYFKKALVYNALLQSIGIVFVWAIFMPLYLHTVNPSVLEDVILLVLLLALKVWNVNMVWKEYYILNSGGYDLIRALCTLIFIGFILFQMPWWALILVIIAMVLVTLFVFSPLTNHLLKWEKVLAGEDQLVERFWRFANLITDVPKMHNRMKPRRWLNGLTNIFSYGKTAVYNKFFIKTFVRSGEYFGIWLRLIIIGVAIMALLPKGLTTVILAVIFTYLTSVQIIGLWKEHLAGPSILISLPFQFKKSGFLNVLALVLTVEIIIFTIAALIFSGSFYIAGLTLLCGMIFSLGFTYGYAGMKLKS